MSLQWRHNERNGVSNHQPRDCLLNRLGRRRLKKPSKLRISGLCGENSPVTGEFPAQRASNAENVSIWWRIMETVRELWYHKVMTSYVLVRQTPGSQVPYNKEYLYVIFLSDIYF